MTPRQFLDTLSDCGLLTAEEADAAADRFGDVVAIDESSDPGSGSGTLDGSGPGPSGTQVRLGGSGGNGGSAAGSVSPQTQAVARALIAEGKLTKFQARAVLGGAAKGLRIGEYVVQEKIGAGGMGTVYKARHRVMKRIVALKLLPRAATLNPRMVQRFYREVEAAAKLTHPNIVTAYDAGEYEGVHYLVSEFVDGLDLSALLKKNGPLSLARAVDYIVQAGRGLAYAHEHGVIHRDVKPGNLLLNRDGVVKVLDMGLARFTEADATMDEASLTVTGRLMGTVEYMAPEHAANPKNADHRSDIYSLGCTFYRLITGKLPYKGETAVELIIAQREQPTPKLTDAVAGVPEAVQRVFERMLAKSPADRYPTMREAIEALEHAAKATKLPPAAAPSAGEFDPRTDSQATKTNTQVRKLLGDSSLLGELAAAASGVHDAIVEEPPASLMAPVKGASGGAAGASGGAEPAFLQAGWTPGQTSVSAAQAPREGPGAMPLIMMGIVAVAAAVGIIWAFAGLGDRGKSPDGVAIVDGGGSPTGGTNPATTGANGSTGATVNPPKPVDPIKPIITEATNPPTTTPTDPTPPTVPDMSMPMLDPQNPPPIGEWRSMFDGVSLDRWVRMTGSDQLGDEPGLVAVEGRQIVLKPGAPITGITWTGPTPPSDYEFALEARLDDAQVLTVAFPVGSQRAAVQLDARQSRIGLYRVDDLAVTDNAVPTKIDNAAGGWQRIRLRVTGSRIDVMLNEQTVISQLRAGHRFGAPRGYHPMEPLTVFVSRGSATLRKTQVRRIEPEPGVAPPDPTEPPTVASPVILEPGEAWHDLLPSVDADRDARGEKLWSIRDGVLTGESTNPQDTARSSLLVPVQISGSYQLRMTVNTRQGGGPVVVMLPAGNERLAMVIDGPRGTGFITRRPDADAERSATRMISQRTMPSPGSYDVQVMVRVLDDRVTANAKVGSRTLPSWTGTEAELRGAGAAGAGPRIAERLAERLGERRGGSTSAAIVLRIGDRQLSIDAMQLNVLPGGRAVMQAVAEDDAGEEMIDLGQPPTGQPGQPGGQPGQPPEPPEGTRPLPPRQLPPRQR